MYDDKFSAYLIWFSQTPLSSSKIYDIQINHNKIKANFLSKENQEISQNSIEKVQIELAQNIVFDKYQTNQQTGSFLVINPISKETVAAGIID